MDPKTQMPDIKAEVLKTDDGKKKGAGLFGLFGGGGGSAAGGLGGLGAGAAGGGGLLATKAGMLALVLIGTSVAGGIGVAGYKIFGPGEADRTGGNFSLFAPKPPQAAGAGAGAVSADGSSQSLTLMAQSAARDREADASASASADAPTDAVAGDPARDAAAADAARREAEARASAGGAINSGGGAGATGSMNRGLMNTKKLGALSGSTGGGASTTASSGAAGKLGDNLAAASRNSTTSGFSRSGPGAKASGARGRAARGGRGARQQARNVMGDQAAGRAGSSFAAGKTYDGSATQAGGAIGPDGGAIGMDGVGDGGSEQPKAIPANSAKNVHEQDPPIPKPKKMVTPWQQAVQRATMLVMLAAALAFAAGKVPKGPYTQIILYAIGVAILAIGAYVGVLAGQIMSGPYGQKSQGMVVAAASLGVILTGIGVIMGANDAEKQDLPKDAKPDAQQDYNNPLGDEAAGGKGLMGNPMVVLGGGIAVVGAIGLMFAPKPKPIELEEGEKKPDVRYEAKPNPVRYMV